MPDDVKNQAAGADADKANGAGENGADTGSDQGTDKEQKSDATKTGNEDAGKGEGKDGEGAKDTSKGNDQAKAPKEGSQNDDEDDGAEPPVKPRLSKQDFIIGRQKAKLAKTAKADENKGGDDDKGDDNSGEDDDEVAPEDEALISKVVAKKFAPIIDKSLKADDDAEVNTFLTENPDFKPFEVKARRYMQHPSRRSLPIEAIFYEVAGKSLIKIGAERQKAADAKAKDSQTGGGSNRSGEGAKSDFDLSKEEFEAKQERIRRGQ